MGQPPIIPPQQPQSEDSDSKQEKAKFYVDLPTHADKKDDGFGIHQRAATVSSTYEVRRPPRASKQQGVDMVDNSAAANNVTMTPGRFRKDKSCHRTLSQEDVSQVGRKQTKILRRLTPLLIRQEELSLVKVINSGVDINALNEEGDAVIHRILKKKKGRLELFLDFLINSKIDVNCPNSDYDTPLHIAIYKEDLQCVKALIVFGADVNKINVRRFTPLDVANNSHLTEIKNLLIKLGAKSSTELSDQTVISKVPRMHSFAENLRPLNNKVPSDKLSDFTTRQLYKDLQNFLQQKSTEHKMDAFVVGEQQKELTEFNRTQQLGGSRILFLDGGGIKGLIQLEILMQIEEATGRSVVELFDWIVGTSSGGVIALALVYGKKSLSSLRQMYFKLKDRVFAKRHYRRGFDSDALDEVLKEYIDPDIIMSTISHPKVLISAVKKVTTNLELHFFNNCFGDEYSEFPVWKVARYTSAAPTYFTEVDNYVDGGLICNNPTEHGLTAIQDFCRKQGIDLPISVVVSVGSGQNPAKPIGVVDTHAALNQLRPDKLINAARNLIELLSNALVETEQVAASSKCRCQGLNIPYFRFSPELKEIISASDTDNDKLVNMIIKTKKSWHKHNLSELSELTQLFHQIANQQQNKSADSSPRQEPVENESFPTVLCKDSGANLDSTEQKKPSDTTAYQQTDHDCKYIATLAPGSHSDGSAECSHKADSVELEESLGFAVAYENK